MKDVNKMKCKKMPMAPKGFFTSAALILGCGLAGSVSAAVDTTTVTVSGKVIANTCTIDQSSYNITLAPVSDRDIKGVGTISAISATVPVLLKNCGAGVTTVIVTASGDRGTGNGDYFANSVNATSGGASGVGVVFYKTDGKTPFNATGSGVETSKLTPSGNTTLTYTAKYIGTAENVVAGDVKTAIAMKFDYQ